MNKIILVVCLTALTGGPSFSQGVKKAGTLKDVVVKEKDTSKIKAEKPILRLKREPIEAVYPSFSDERLLETQFPDIPLPCAINPYGLDSDGPAKPWLTSIRRREEMKFNLNLPDGYPVEKWDLIVTDYRATTLRSFSGRKKAPEYVGWDLRDKRGNIIRVGRAYSYIFTLADRAGNSRSVEGKPFVINALVHREEEGLVISLASEFLFEPELNKRLIDEASDVIKEHYYRPLTVRSFFESEESALRQAELIAKELAERLMISEVAIKTEGLRTSPENFHVDLLILNRRD